MLNSEYAWEAVARTLHFGAHLTLDDDMFADLCLLRDIANHHAIQLEKDSWLVAANR
jgi:hypothetical protein